MEGSFRVRLYDVQGCAGPEVPQALAQNALPLVEEWTGLRNQILRGLPSFAFASFFGAASGYRTAAGLRPGITSPFSLEGSQTRLLFAVCLTTRQDLADDPEEAQKASFAWTDPNLHDLGTYVLPQSVKRFDEVSVLTASDPPGTLEFEWLYGTGQANGVAHSLEVWGRIDPTEDSVPRECFRVARRLFSSGGVARPFVKTSGRVATLTWTLTLRALR